MKPYTSLQIFIVALLVGLSWSATAAQLQVSVTGADGKPVPDVAVQVQPTGNWPAQATPEPAVIAQQNIRFVPFLTIVPVGASVRFVNRDRYDHHVRSLPGGPLGNLPPARQFEFRMAALNAAGREAQSADLKLDLPGTIALGCHLHGSMRGHILISTTPWFAVTDAQGKVRIDNLPDGQAEVRLWHPDQLSDQAALRVQLGGNVVTEGKLNFSPRRRSPAPAATSDYEVKN